MSLLPAILDALIPRDEFPSATDVDAVAFLEKLSPAGLSAALATVERELSNHPDLASTLAALDPKILRQFAHWAAEAYYSDPRSWPMLHYRMDRDPVPRPAENSIRLTASPAIRADYDVIVIGAGAGGGVIAAQLSAAGARVLLLERGRWLAFAAVGRDHLRNHRLALYGHNTGPDLEGHPRVFHDRVVPPHAGEYHNNAMTLGGGTRVFGAQAWRYLPEDFQMATRYGVPADSSLADWPIAYADLAPFYDQAEWELGVAGTPHHRCGPRARNYPMPPVPDNPARQILAAGAAQLGWPVAPPPLLINTRPYNDRPACVQCGACVGFACPSDSKNGSHNTVIPRALATGNCDLVERAQAEKILPNGVALVIEDSIGTVTRREIRAGRIVVCAGAVETARLLWNSGIGNHSDQLGRNYCGHFYTHAHGLFRDIVQDGNGPGVSIATCRFSHDNPGIIGGGMLANEFVKLPIIHWKTALPPDVPLWGAANKKFMRDNYARTIQLNGPIHDIPNPNARVTVSSHVRDKFGIPVAQLTGTCHPETLRAADFLQARAVEWLQASGATKVWAHQNQPHLTGGQHQAGTCRMGDDPATSVCDRWGRVHGHDNLYVADGSLHVTNGGFNPVLTIYALAYRIAKHLSD